MPIYEYQCDACDKEFEELVRSADHASIKCPKCGGRKVKRRLSVFAARQAESPSSAPGPAGPCGRCGDPGGSCRFD